MGGEQQGAKNWRGGWDAGYEWAQEGRQGCVQIKDGLPALAN